MTDADTIDLISALHLGLPSLVIDFGAEVSPLDRKQLREILVRHGLCQIKRPSDARAVITQSMLSHLRTLHPEMDLSERSVLRSMVEANASMQASSLLQLESMKKHWSLEDTTLLKETVPEVEEAEIVDALFTDPASARLVYEMMGRILPPYEDDWTDDEHSRIRTSVTGEIVGMILATANSDGSYTWTATPETGMTMGASPSLARAEADLDALLMEKGWVLL